MAAVLPPFLAVAETSTVSPWLALVTGAPARVTVTSSTNVRSALRSLMARLWLMALLSWLISMVYRMRRCTGLRPSLTSGSALPTMTLIA